MLLSTICDIANNFSILYDVNSNISLKGAFRIGTELEDQHLHFLLFVSNSKICKANTIFKIESVMLFCKFPPKNRKIKSFAGMSCIYWTIFITVNVVNVVVAETWKFHLSSEGLFRKNIRDEIKVGYKIGRYTYTSFACAPNKMRELNSLS